MYSIAIHRTNTNNFLAELAAHSTPIVQNPIRSCLPCCRKIEGRFSTSTTESLVKLYGQSVCLFVNAVFVDYILSHCILYFNELKAILQTHYMHHHIPLPSTNIFCQITDNTVRRYINICKRNIFAKEFAQTDSKWKKLIVGVPPSSSSLSYK